MSSILVFVVDDGDDDDDDDDDDDNDDDDDDDHSQHFFSINISIQRRLPPQIVLLITYLLDLNDLMPAFSWLLPNFLTDYFISSFLDSFV